MNPSGTSRRARSTSGGPISAPATLAVVLVALLALVPPSRASDPSALPVGFVARGSAIDPFGYGNGWSSDHTPSHVGTALPITTVVVGNLSMGGPVADSVLTRVPSIPSAFRHPGPSVLAGAGIARPSGQAVGVGFEGLNDSQCGCAPPDVIDAAGPTQVVEMVNQWFEVWTTTGVPVHSVSASAFFGSGSDFLSDPRILFDNGSGRWFASILDIPASGPGLIRFAVSSTSDAAGAWTIYTSVTAPAGEFPDQPILGVSDRVLAFGGNMFSSTAFYGAEYWVVNKSAVLNGSAASVQSWGPDPNYLSIHPVQSLGPSATQFFASSTSASSTTVSLWAVTGVPPTAVSAQRNLTVAAYTTAPSGRAPGGGLIDSADTRVQGAVWESGNLWLAFDDQCTPRGDSTPRACIRVLEVATASAGVLQDFDYGVAGLDLYYPAISLDHLGDLTMVFGYSSASVDPSGGVTGQATTDPPGTLQTYRTVVAGSGSQNCGAPCRYGDYFGAGTDPGSNTVWVAAEFLTPLHVWDSWIAPVITSGPASAAVGATPPAVDLGSATTIQLIGKNLTCSALFGLYCAASVPLGDGTTVTAPCSATSSAFSWAHTFPAVGTYLVGQGGYLSEFTSPSCIPGTEDVNLSLPAYSLEVAPAPAVQLTGSPANGADVGQTFSFSVLVAGGRAPYTFAWGGLPNGCAPSSGPSVNCTATAAGNWLVTVNVTDAAGVSRVPTLPFVISPALSTSLAATRTLLDVGQEVTFVATAAGGSASYGYLWTGLPTGCYGTNVSSLACSPTAAGTFSVQELTQDTNGVSAVSDAISVEVLPRIGITLLVPSDATAGGSAVLEANISGGLAPFAVSWTGLPSGCSTENSSRISCTPTASGVWSVTVSVIDMLGGSANATASWTVAGASAALTISPETALLLVAITSVAVLAIGLWVRRRPSRPPRAGK